jgi:penicillin amidase
MLCNTGVGQPGFGTASGAEYRLVVAFADLDHLPAMQNIGNSGRPDSPHYRDQFADRLVGRYRVVRLRREDVERDIESAVRPERAQPVPQSLPV